MEERVLRVNQLDATELDEELTGILESQFLNIFKLLPSSRLLCLQPELKALVRLLIWKTSIWSRGQSFGQQMMDLKYSLGGKQFSPITLRYKISLFVLAVLTEWVKDRSDLFSKLAPSLSLSSGQKLLNGVLTITRVLSLINFILFLLRGSYPTLKERLLGLSMVPVRPQTLRQMSYEYMNREILWHGFSEFIFFVVPHFNLFVLRNWFRRCLKFRFPARVESTRSSTGLRSSDFLSCSFCESTPTMPYATDCGHVYCYYCLRANCMADGGFPCAACGRAVAELIPARLLET